MSKNHFCHRIWTCITALSLAPMVATASSEIYFGFQQEVQNFYLTPKNDANTLLRTDFLSKGKITLNSSLLFDTDASVGLTWLNKQDQGGFLFNPKHLGLRYNHKDFEFFLGGFTLAGDGADINNIFDVVNAQDLRQPFNSKTIGSIGALASWTNDFISLRGFFIPKNEKSKLPDTQSPWWPRAGRLPVTNSTGTFIISENLNYKIASETEIKNPFLNNFGGTAKLTWKNIDLTTFYFKGAHQTPQIIPSFDFDATSLDPLIGVVRDPIQLNLAWYQSEHIGGGLGFLIDPVIGKIYCKNQKDFILSGEQKITACTGTLESTLQVSKFSLRYFLQANRLWKSAATARELDSLLGFFEKSMALGFYLDFESVGTLSGAVIYNEKDPAYLTAISYEHRLTDQFRVKLSANLITPVASSATENPLADAYDKTDNLAMLLSYDF